MSVQERTGNIFESGAQALVNPVNCVGVMGKGLALEFKKRFPKNTERYVRACRMHAIQPGQVWVVPVSDAPRRYVINLPTKRHWKMPSYPDDVQAGIQALVGAVRDHEIASIAIPALGCGLGGLAWRDVRQWLLDAFAKLPDVEVMLYGPHEEG